MITSREKQSKYRASQRNRGYSTINKWVPRPIKNNVYKVLDFINGDYVTGHGSFVAFLADIIDAPTGTKLYAFKKNDKWHFEMRYPNS